MVKRAMGKMPAVKVRASFQERTKQMIIVARIVKVDLTNIETLVESESWMTAVSPLSLDTKKELTLL